MLKENNLNQQYYFYNLFKKLNKIQISKLEYEEFLILKIIVYLKTKIIKIQYFHKIFVKFNKFYLINER